MCDLHQMIIIIPCYEPSEKKFIPYVETLLNQNISDIVIVDDGSGDKYSHVFAKLSALNTAKIHLISYPHNRGKGYALKTAFRYCKEHFQEDSVFITADCDGQHKLEDVMAVGAYTLKMPHTFVLGSRDFSLPHVPKRSRTGNTKIRALLKFFYGIKASDTQTGLRGFSYTLLDTLIDISGDRFEYETNQLIVLSQQNIPIREVFIQTVYEEKAEDVEKGSHFHAIRDSLRVLSVLFQKLEWYFFSSVLSSIIDVAVFALLFSLILQTPSLTLKTLIATVVARVLSSVVNFTCNYKLVFHGSTGRSLYRYYLLWALQLCASFGLARLWAGVTSIKLLVSVLKTVSDLGLALLSYQIQNKWVFANRKPPRYFFGGFACFTRGVFNLFRRKYDASEIAYPGEGCVYVCRHLNMHGFYTIAKSLSFDTHIMAYHMFFTYKDAFRQYSEITFSAEGKATFASKCKAFFPALIVPPLLKSLKAIPVYRGSIESCQTLRRANKHLLNRECVTLFPDIDYKAPQERKSEIYKGFLLLEKSYFRKTGKHLKFIPLYLDDKEKKIYMNPPICFEDGDFKPQMEEVADRIKASLQTNLSK